MRLCHIFLNWLVITSATNASVLADEAFYRGYYAQAVAEWQQQDNSLTDLMMRLQLQRRSATAYRHLGNYKQAHTLLLQAIADAEWDALHGMHARLLSEQSRVFIAEGNYADARVAAKKSQDIAAQQTEPMVTADVLLQYGDLQTLDGYHAEAVATYDEALRQMTPSQNDAAREMRGKILFNRTRAVYLQEKNTAQTGFGQTRQAIQRADSAARNWRDIYSLILAQVGLSQLLMELPNVNANDLQQASGLLQRAELKAMRLDNPLALMHVQEAKSYLLHKQERNADALTTLRQALFLAQQHAPDPAHLYRLLYQTGRLLHILDKPQAAMTAYIKAAELLQTVREQTANSGYQVKQTHFHDKVLPVYSDALSLILSEAVKEENSDTLLQQARDLVQSRQQSELSNFFKSRCNFTNAQCKSQQQIGPHTAIFYPQVLNERLELLFWLPFSGTLEQIPVKIDKAILSANVARLTARLNSPPPGAIELSGNVELCSDTSAISADNLDKMQQHVRDVVIPAAQELHQLLIQPILPILQNYNIHTLVIVPDGILRTVPFAVLHDGQQFLVEHYATATLPTMPKICSTPDAPTEKIFQQRNVLLTGLSKAVKGYSELPCAEHELKTLDEMYQTGASLLLNDQFTEEQVRDTVLKTPYQVIHTASHAKFGLTASDSFILTWQDEMELDGLERIIQQATKTVGGRVELLTLSACETAKGDAQAALGLAGVAIKSGAKSALASLWRVSDAGTPALILEFYKRLENVKDSKVQALQKAQQTMLTHPRYQHPYYWAAFLLIGDWL